MPDDKKKRPSASTIAKVTGKPPTLGVGPFLYVKDIVSRFALNRMAENLYPYDYADAGSGRSTVDRFIDAVILNKKEEERAGVDQYIEKGYGRIPYKNYRERVDLLQMLAGKPQKYNTIERSQYTPSKNPEKGAQYYRSKGIEQQILKELGLDKAIIKNRADLEKLVSPISAERTKTGGYSAIIPGLARATYDIGSDNKGLYLSYSDKWDLDPQEGEYGDKKQAGVSTFGALKDYAKKMATNIVTSTATPARVYGRIYFDPKTGKPIN